LRVTPPSSRRDKTPCTRASALAARSSGNRARPTTMGGRRGGGLGRTGSSPRFQGLPWHPQDHPRHHRWSLSVVPFLSLDRLQKLYSRRYIMPPHAAMVMVGLAGFFRCFRDASFRHNHQAGYGSPSCKAMRTILAGSMMPFRTCRSTHSLGVIAECSGSLIHDLADHDRALHACILRDLADWRLQCVAHMLMPAS
jgi:hypothetical protein